MVEVKYVGWDELQVDNVEILQAKSLVEKHAQRIELLVHNTLELVVHVKEYDKAGERKKYSVHIRATYPGDTIISDKAHDWQLKRAVQQGLEAIEHQLQHKFKT